MLPMKKVILAFALFGLLGASAPAMACEGGKCTMDHAKDGGAKTKKGKKAAKEESCHMTETSKEKTKSCCVKPEAAKEESTKEVKKAQ